MEPEEFEIDCVELEFVEDELEFVEVEPDEMVEDELDAVVEDELDADEVVTVVAIGARYTKFCIALPAGFEIST